MGQTLRAEAAGMLHAGQVPGVTLEGTHHGAAVLIGRRQAVWGVLGQGAGGILIPGARGQILAHRPDVPVVRAAVIAHRRVIELGSIFRTIGKIRIDAGRQRAVRRRVGWRLSDLLPFVGIMGCLS